MNNETVYQVVINSEQRYSLWPAHQVLPWGWQIVNVSGDRQHCLNYIEKCWLDMRPASLTSVRQN